MGTALAKLNRSQNQIFAYTHGHNPGYKFIFLQSPPSLPHARICFCSLGKTSTFPVRCGRGQLEEKACRFEDDKNGAAPDEHELLERVWKMVFLPQYSVF